MPYDCHNVCSRYYAETKSCDIEEKREINIIAVQQDLMQPFVNDHGERCRTVGEVLPSCKVERCTLQIS